MIKHVMKKAGLTMGAKKADQLLALVRAESLRKKAVLSSSELVRLYKELN